MKRSWSHLLWFFLIATVLFRSCPCDSTGTELFKEVTSKVVEKDNPSWHFEIKNDSPKERDRRRIGRIFEERSLDSKNTLLPRFQENDSGREMEKRIKFPSSKHYNGYGRGPFSPLQKRIWKGLIVDPREEGTNQEDDLIAEIQKRLLEPAESSLPNYFDDEGDMNVEQDLWSDHELNKRLWKGIVGNNEMKRIWKGIMGRENDK